MGVNAHPSAVHFCATSVQYGHSYRSIWDTQPPRVSPLPATKRARWCSLGHFWRFPRSRAAFTHDCGVVCDSPKTRAQRYRIRTRFGLKWWPIVFDSHWSPGPNRGVASKASLQGTAVLEPPRSAAHIFSFGFCLSRPPAAPTARLQVEVTGPTQELQDSGSPARLAAPHAPSDVPDAPTADTPTRRPARGVGSTLRSIRAAGPRIRRPHVPRIRPSSIRARVHTFESFKYRNYRPHVGRHRLLKRRVLASAGHRRVDSLRADKVAVPHHRRHGPGRAAYPDSRPGRRPAGGLVGQAQAAGGDAGLPVRRHGDLRRGGHTWAVGDVAHIRLHLRDGIRVRHPGPDPHDDYRQLGAQQQPS